MPEQHLEKRGQSMAYKLNVTEHADELLDNLVYHLIYRLKNKQAAEGTTLADLLKQADKMLYEVKQAGKDGYKIITKKIAGKNNIFHF